jgi:hypothetical protein
MADVFLSHARADRAQAAAIARAVEAGGRSTWWDRQTAGSEAIERELDAAGSVVVAWSRPARDSLWVLAEANAALDRGKLVQLNLDGASLPLPFAMLHFLDLRMWSGAREEMPWPEVEARLQAFDRVDGARPPGAGGVPFASGADRALQGFGRYAILGWTAIAAALLTGLFTVAAARGNIDGGTLGVVSLAMLVLSIGLLGVSAFVLGRTMAASRR